MADYAAAHGLVREPSFRRFLATSTALHLGMVGFAAFMPHFAAPLRPPAIVMVDVNMPAPAPAPAKPAPPAPPEPAPPKPPAPEPEPKQSVDEAVVIPPVPRAKPLDKERPEPEPKPPEKKPEPPKPPQKPEKKPEPRPPQPSAAELIQKMRDKVGPITPVPSTAAGGAPGEIDPELASYQQRLQACFYSNWVGIQRYSRRHDLQVEFQVRVNPSGGIVSVDKVRASGESVLDESAERAIYRCAPQFPPPPEGRTLLRFIFIPGDVI